MHGDKVRGYGKHLFMCAAASSGEAQRAENESPADVGIKGMDGLC
jgi:hypothetical protein